MYAPAAWTGMCFCPSRTPGSVSTSNSRKESSWWRAKVRTCSWTKRMSSMTCWGTDAMIFSTSSSVSRKESGLHLSNFSE